MGSQGTEEVAYLSGPCWLVSRINAPTIMIQGLPVSRQDLLLLLLLELLLLLLLLQGLEVGMFLLQLSLEPLRLPLLLQLLPLVFLGPTVGREGSAECGLCKLEQACLFFPLLPRQEPLPWSWKARFPDVFPSQCREAAQNGIFPRTLRDPVTSSRACSWSSCCWRISSCLCSSSSL